MEGYNLEDVGSETSLVGPVSTCKALIRNVCDMQCRIMDRIDDLKVHNMNLRMEDQNIGMLP